MFKISYKDLRSDALHRTLQKVAQSTSYKNIVKLKKVAALVKAMDKAITQSQKEWLALADKLIKKDPEKGNYLIDQKGPNWLDGVDKAQGEKEIDLFTEKEALIEAEQITAHDIETVEISPADLVALSAVMK